MDKKRNLLEAFMTKRLEEPKFREIVRNTPLVSIDLIARNSQREVLLGLRRNGPAKNFWFVPGGRIMKDEPLESAFKRITKDELGVPLEINSARFLGVYEHFYRGNFADDPSFGTHYVVLGYEVNLSGIQIRFPVEQHSQFRWETEIELLSSDEVHSYTKNYFHYRHSADTSHLIALYNIYQSAISSYTNTVWAFPAAFLGLNCIVWGMLKDSPKLIAALVPLFVVTPLNFLFVQAFFKLVRNQQSVRDAIRSVEGLLATKIINLNSSILIPEFERNYNWFTRKKSAVYFKWALFTFSLSYFAYSFIYLIYLFKKHSIGKLSLADIFRISN